MRSCWRSKGALTPIGTFRGAEAGTRAGGGVGGQSLGRGYGIRPTIHPSDPPCLLVAPTPWLAHTVLNHEGRGGSCFIGKNETSNSGVSRFDKWHSFCYFYGS